MSTVSRAGLKVRAAEWTGVCEYCAKTYRRDELHWVCEGWVATDGRRGHTTATLCPSCARLALAHCWICGALTGRTDDLCQACVEGRSA